MRIRTGSWLTGALLLALLLAPTAGGAESRTVQGIVVDRSGEPLEGAVIQIENLQTLMIRSFISQKDGAFHFMGLNPDMDYNLKARYRGQWSPAKSISRFDSSQTVNVVLTIDVNQPGLACSRCSGPG